ncbi:hypothetical protein F4820DRAFT_69283 [Hypoxylon rubiginosum]|uniref:Uncharacterized protein n=1 Tax=Hypoxylon rubiginosum TaxID=110542 RepID=A0ACB9YQ88_9PEZI|nr:hypothetical protein F4820DRAFT_69283 [Hypoxylon rubiginosum]
MAAAYGQVPQHDNDDDDRNYGPSPSMSLSPAHSSSPMPFLPAVESTFTPLSMDSDFYSGAGVGVGAAGGEVAESNPHDKASHKKIGSTATTRAGARINTVVQSLSPTRATHNSRSEYGLLSPDTTLSSPSSSPNQTPYRSNISSSPYLKLAADDDLPSSNVNIHPLDLKATGGSTAGESKVKEPPSRQRQPVLVKPMPIVRAASTKSVSLRHPTPDSNTRSSSYVTNIAQLEATAEKLSMTSSIEDAIRDLHEEQKRNESRRSSILAASIGSIPEDNEPVSFPVSKPLSTASSILETNSAARYGGYSPAGFVMSPNPSLLSNPTRLRSGSGTLSAAESEVGGFMSRQGPGKSSVRSVRSASKPTLTDIAELEPTTLTPAAMDAADRLAEEPEEETLKIPRMEDIDLTPNAEQYGTSNGYDYWDQAVAEARRGDEHDGRDDRPPTSAGSTGTYELAEKAFADFDGAHCPSDVDLEETLFMPSLTNGPSTDTPFLQPFDYDLSKDEEDPNPSRPVISRPIGPPTVRPKSYMDPETGQTMLFYPARVPLMLNLPQKLSKKPKAEARNARRSQVLEKMTETNRQSSTTWLPEFLSDPLPDPTGSGYEQANHLAAADLDAEPRVPSGSEGQRQSQFQPRLDQGAINKDARKSRTSIIDIDKRKSRLDGLPPQLRASAFFDLPSELPTVQLKDGSAMATLDSILDASAKAPVSAFTDHAFAGTLGSEVYGTEKKRKSHMKSASTTDLLEPKKRSSFLHLRKPSALSRHSISQEGQRNASLAGTRMDEAPNGKDEQDEERQRLPSSIDGQPVPGQDQDEESEEEEPLYDGPPTTLLAELQIRKQQQKLRTRPVATAFPNGLHSTLLDMDTVAQIEREARKGKKINLAWEDPNVDPANSSEDEDTPLGLLMASRGQNNDMTATIAEINRPLGLMERRDMEDNEPLSRRRDRLQGKEAGPVKRQSMMTLGQGMHNVNNASGSLVAPSLQLRVHTPEEDEVEGETLGERMRRLKAREQGDNLLPQARPVSSAFSTELLSQIGDAFKEDENDGKSQDKKLKPKEEETLGQRRRRLQAEREAREGRVASMMLTSGIANDAPKLTKRHSLADVLGARNGSRNILSDPRAEADRAKQEEAARYRQSQEQKMAALRNQMPSSLSTPNLNRPGGYMAGRFNDGTGGAIGHLRTSTALGGYPSQSIGTGMMNPGMVANAYATGGSVVGQLPYVPNGYGVQMSNPYGMPIQPPAQMDRVERWRQSIQP